ncbi:TPA: lantibiotic dehydratase family protein [Elizabethkingia anophelis]|uniref:lantibiotic dehydratase family protein n=1 Tax=Elizabethkingia anophelis TaxID=1117645 RepID=UPI0021A304EA|nr:lantibiotic dehydratase family protein [Elizabethkingia anophelis]MCT3682415.1 lantibiotic dehydratase family protein [Elizabethkingia anophelis]MCT3701610.1 lantibiotic dehydratase family protein [Elizabethkingia anophelis]MCT3770657.1 lantibiotic dehydratase family protein [Elizabethkingia anophelis]MCT3780945.1 lantibiotic dehydratase family protein [Elizabethkingia anophelis]
MSQFPYKTTEYYILRTPAKPISILKNVLKNSYLSDSTLKKVCNDLYFQEAIFLASPSLHKTMLEWLDNNIKEAKIEKLKITLLKYVSRMSSRCTPFGLFAGYSLGKLDMATNIEVNNETSYKRFTRLDMQYLVTLVQNLSTNKKLREGLTYFPNSSIYKVGDQYRYVEYSYSHGLRRTHHIEAIENDDYFQHVLEVSHNGASIENLISALTTLDTEITHKEAKKFIHELIDNQILVSNLEPSAVGEDYFTRIKNILSEKDKKLTTNLEFIDKNITNLDLNIPNTVDKYYSIKESIEKLGTEIDLKFLFQTDLNTATVNNQLEKRIISDIKDGFIFLNRLSNLSKTESQTTIDNFTKQFKERYEEKEISLSHALDPEIGIGYNNENNIVPGNHFLEAISLSPNRNGNRSLKWNTTTSLIHYKISEAYKNNESVIVLKPSDIPQNQVDLSDDLPDTISCATELIMEEGKQKIVLQGIYGPSGTNLFGRFCLNDKELYQHTQNIINIEQGINKDYIIADLAHLPESRIGNVICRPHFNTYEIVYLSHSTKLKEHQISIEDLMISIRQNKIVLRSKKLNKIIIPRLSNAHNYSVNSLPIYHFLCDLQGQGKRHGLALSLGDMERNYKYIPRIEYKNLILKPATWHLRRKDLKFYTEKLVSDIELLDAASEIRKKWKMPAYILLIENDNELLINLENISSIKMMIDAIGNSENFTFKEFLYHDDQQIVKRGKDSFTNQFIFTFYNNQKLTTANND